MADMAVIHKVLYRMDLPPGTDLVQPLEVPADAELVAVGWDTRLVLAVALWYRWSPPGDGRRVTWHVTVAGTGHEFPADGRHLGTVVRDGFAWHLLDVGGAHVRRAAP